MNEDIILSIMQEVKPNQVEKLKLPNERVKHFFEQGASAEKIQGTIIKALELWGKYKDGV